MIQLDEVKKSEVKKVIFKEEVVEEIVEQAKEEVVEKVKAPIAKKVIPTKTVEESIKKVMAKKKNK